MIVYAYQDSLENDVKTNVLKTSTARTARMIVYARMAEHAKNLPENVNVQLDGQENIAQLFVKRFDN